MTTGKTGGPQGRSPRHSKAAKPVTLDLKPEAVTADPASDNDTTKSATQPDMGAAAKSVPQAGPKRQATGSQGPAEHPDASTTSDTVTGTGTGASVGIGAAATTAADGKKAEPMASADAIKASAASSSASAKTGRAPGGNNDGGNDGKSGLGGVLAGGVIGGAIALLAMFGLQSSGLLPTPGGNSTSTSESAAVSGEIDQLRTTVDQLSSSVSKLSVTDSQTPDLSTLASRLDALEAVNGGVGTSADVAELKSAIAELSAKSLELSAGLAGLQGNLDEVSNKVSALGSQQSDLSQSLTSRIEEAEAAANSPGKDLAMARAIAVSGLKTAIDRGGPFASELEAFASVAPDDPAVADLRSFAATGVPTKGQLLEAFPEAANRMVASMNPVSDDAGVVQRLWSSAQSVVKVRKVGDVEGDGTEAIVARMETDLKNGDLDAARAEWAKLSPEAKAAAEDFGKGLAARGEVEKLLATVQIASPETANDNSGDAADVVTPKTAE